MTWYNDEDLAGNFLSCKEGETLKVMVKDMRKVVGGFSKFHYKKKDGSPILTQESKEPFHHELEADSGKVLTVGAISLMVALKNAEVVAGDDIEITHPARGKYEVKKFNVKKDEGTSDELETNLPF